MFGKRWQLFRLVGIPISVDLSWLIILALLTWSISTVFRAELPDQPATTYWLCGLAAALIFFICIVLHELGHALVAQAVGIPIRGITLFLFGGVSQLEEEPSSAGSEFVMAIAGPAVSAVLAAGFFVLSLVGAKADWPPLATLLARYLAEVNALVLVFNLLPAFPLDGGRVFRSILWGILRRQRRATHIAAIVGQVFAWIFIGIGVVLFFTGDLVDGLWLGLIGLFLNNAARSTYQQVVIREILHGEPISRFMNRQPVVVPPSLDLRHWVDDYVYRYHRKMFPVASNGHLEGYVGTRVLERIPREEWGQHSVAEVMRHDIKDVSIPPNADALEALSQMQRTGSSRLLVTDGDHLVGIVSLKDLLRFLHLKLDLESSEERTPTSV